MFLNFVGELYVKEKVPEKDYRKESRLLVIVQDRNGDMQARSTICPILIIAGKLNLQIKFLEPVDRNIKYKFGVLLLSLLIK